MKSTSPPAIVRCASRSAAVDDGLLTALGVQPAQGRLFSKGETDLTGPPPTPGAPPIPLPPIVILSHELWQSAFGGRTIVGQTVEVNGLPREVIGIMPPGVDVMDNRTEIWLPLGLNPGNRQNRGSHFLYLIGRLKDGVTAEQAQTELTALIRNWGERVGVKQHVFAPLPANDADRKSNPGAGHLLQMKPVQERDRRQRQPGDLGAAGGGRVRAADRLRQPREPAAGAGRDPAIASLPCARRSAPAAAACCASS